MAELCGFCEGILLYRVLSRRRSRRCAGNSADRGEVLYMDNARRTRPLEEALSRMEEFYVRENADSSGAACSNSLSKQAFGSFEDARSVIREFISAKSNDEIVFTRNTAEAINLVAHSWGMKNLQKGDEVVISTAEHHDNLVCWQMVAERTGAVLRYMPVSADGTVDHRALAKAITFRTKLLAVAHVSHVTGSINDVKSMVEFAKCVNVKVLVDASQSLAHVMVDVQRLGCDFLVASSEKVFAPGGAGFLFARAPLLDKLDPFLVGGESMFRDVSKSAATFQGPSAKFEAGLAPLAQAVAFAGAVQKLMTSRSLTEAKVPIDRRSARLSEHLLKRLRKHETVTLYGVGRGKAPRAPICTFNVHGVIPEELHSALLERGVVTSVGTQDAALYHRELGISSSLRVSLCRYSSLEDIDRFDLLLCDAARALGVALDAAATPNL